ncbi:MAG: UDP-N-acetylgalactosamine-undecaprenyl-phosphate N-acetylgalactosaminephosphotransferase [Steroidobacteraceae bacterium]|nr:UDP-N-acetylgalactosamine-undecaprenyl-phosphate N-acetylgalactosaminephosphotransferase [Steroidobacteraceae bacterium]
MLKRALDIAVASVGLLVTSPLLLGVMVVVWLGDRHSPLYIAPRVARGGGQFRMVKLRSMSVGADRTGVSSTSNSDRRITPVGHFIRRYKLDEITQLWNVLVGDMSLVGPRPQVRSAVNLYTPREMRLLTIRPGITDFASIVFADEGAILAGSHNPDADYDALIRPWKSRLGLIYIENQSITLDAQLIAATLLAIVSRKRALGLVRKLLERTHAPHDVIRVATRQHHLMPATPP